MKSIKLTFLILVTLFFSCKETSNKQLFFVGTYTATRIPDSKSEGIYSYTIDSNGTIDSIGIAGKTNSPSFITKSIDHTYLIATNSVQDGSITSFKIEKNTLKKISESETGNNPCYVSSGYNGYVLTANYHSGTYNLHQLDSKGKLSKTLDIHKSDFTIPSNHQRQENPHAHSCFFEPNSNNIITIDLGTNKLIFDHIDKEKNTIEPNEFNELQMPKHCGPRILTFHPNQPWIYVVNELNSTVTFIKKDVSENSYAIVETIPTLNGNDLIGNSAAHIEISKDGKYVYMSNRGHDSIGVLEVLPTGKLKLIQTISTYGKHPRHFTLSPENQFLLVANRDDNSICSFDRNTETGKLNFINKVFAPKPVCLLF